MSDIKKVLEEEGRRLGVSTQVEVITPFLVLVILRDGIKKSALLMDLGETDV